MRAGKNKIVAFVHKGDGWYLPLAIAQAKHTLRDCLIVLIGDRDALYSVRQYQQLYREIEFIEISSLRSEEENHFCAMNKHMLYKHMNSVPYSSEFTSCSRWFWLAEFLRKNRQDSLWYFDSDVLVYPAANAYMDKMSRLPVDCGLIVPFQSEEGFVWVASGGCSYWKIDPLQDFCKFMLKSFRDNVLLEQYEKKWAWHQKNNVPGGICDMTVLYLYLKDRPRRIVNLCKAEEKLVFDVTITIPDNYSENEYMMTGGMKEIEFNGGNPYFRRREAPQEKIAACALHFQGESKKYMTRYYTGSALQKRYIAGFCQFGRRVKRKMVNLSK